MIAFILGGIGLFLLGMWLLTDGLKLAGGLALDQFLGRWSSTRLRGLLSGLTITAVVQSSSAVTLATIGVVNAGLLSLEQAIWIIFGSNVGTTLTGWLVVVLGLSIKIDYYALPLIGLGALLRVFSRGIALRSLGIVLAGFGLLFLGIDVLKDSFTDLSQSFDLSVLNFNGVWGLIVMLLAGTLMTILMQSSSAAIAVILTAVLSGAIGVQAAAAAVIGANIGTTSTALLAVIGATLNAKRLAMAHVLFNLLTAVVALCMLPWFLESINALLKMNHSAVIPSLQIALFHTSFNLVGVLLMFPLSRFMTQWLYTRVTSRETSISKPQYLDATVAKVPKLALRALEKELLRVYGLFVPAFRSVMRPHSKLGFWGHMQIQNELRELLLTTGRFISDTARQPMDEQTANGLSEGLRVVQYYLLAVDNMQTLSHLARQVQQYGKVDRSKSVKKWLKSVHDHLKICDPSTVDFSVEACQSSLDALIGDYEQAKQKLLRAAVIKQSSIRATEYQSQHISTIRWLIEQTTKAVIKSHALTERVVA